ncbi:MAG: hypothetical protein HFE43_00480 [Oscillospiraceae bacterium]|jgi:type I restriction enzyme S subunit|nr:hypothetical protein [Oscillospiraceae bacterium]
MARGKKAAKELSPKEKLQQAFVPAEEQPYPIPENWCWAYIGNCYEVTSSKRVHKEDWKDSGVPFYRTRELVKLSENGYVDNELFIANELYKKLVADYGKPKIGDILISGVGTIGVPFIVKENAPFYFKDGNIIWFQCKGICLPEYIFYLYKSNFMSNLIHDMSAGTTVDTYTIINANRTMFPLPPLAEQKRIVTRIESLFAKLDEAKEKAQAVVDGFELRKSAILHKAFTGELTERWRNERGADKWLTSTFGKYTNSQYGYTESATQEPIGPKFLRITDIQDGVVDWDKVPYCAISKDDFEKYSMKQGDIVIARTGATTGKSYLIADDVKAVFASYLIRLTMKQAGLIARYLYYFMQSPSYWQQITEFSAGIAQPGVNAKKLQKIELPIPSVDEQKQIVFVLGKILRKERQAKEAAETVLDQIDTMKKAILARAFRGELGTNNPEEEWAGELLKKTL